jgi:hypothetical protein
MVVEPGGFRTDFGRRSPQQSRDIIADYAETAGKRRKENESAATDQRPSCWCSGTTRWPASGVSSVRFAPRPMPGRRPA